MVRTVIAVAFVLLFCATLWNGEDATTTPIPPVVITENPCDYGYAPGLVSGKNKCVDVDECRQNNVCEHGDCVNLVGSFQCINCQTGFQQGFSLQSCIDLNECSSRRLRRRGLCRNGKCNNNIGSYSCKCNAGYRLRNNNVTNLVDCIDIDECAGGELCANGNCINLPGKYRCVCDAGYEPDDRHQSCTKSYCGGTINKTKASIKYPVKRSKYRNREKCRWTVRVPRNYSISVRFIKLDLEMNSRCSYDYLKITSNYLDLAGVKPFCGLSHEKPGNFTWEPKKNHTLNGTIDSTIEFYFKSDGSIVRSGFEIQFELTP